MDKVHITALVPQCEPGSRQNVLPIVREEFLRNAVVLRAVRAGVVQRPDVADTVVVVPRLLQEGRTLAEQVLVPDVVTDLRAQAAIQRLVTYRGEVLEVFAVDLYGQLPVPQHHSRHLPVVGGQPKPGVKVLLFWVTYLKLAEADAE